MEIAAPKRHSSVCVGVNLGGDEGEACDREEGEEAGDVHDVVDGCLDFD